MPKFKVVSDFTPRGDQPKAIEKLVEGVNKNYRFQTLLGVTGSGKTYTMAKVIEKLQRPTLVIAHNKTLAAQLCSEFRHFFPENAVEYFVSYYDYYQPEAYIPQTDTYIEKESSINEEIDRLRHSSTQAILTRRDVIVVASVSCIYNIGSPIAYSQVSLNIKKGEFISQKKFLKDLVDIYYERNDFETKRGTFKVRGDIIQIYPADQDVILQIQFFGDEVEKISYLDILTKKVKSEVDKVTIFPARHYVTISDLMEDAFLSIEEELKERVAFFKSQGKYLEAQRLEQRTRQDMEMIREFGYCNGIENYSRHFDGRAPGEPPYTLLSYFPDDFIIFIDESHVTIPQLEGMYKGDKARKDNLIEYGFRLPSAYDNRPLKFSEVEKYFKNVIFVSATPHKYEKKHSQQIVEQIVRPTGLVDPAIVIKPAKNQVEKLLEVVKEKVKLNERVIVTTLTKKSSESLCEYLISKGIKARYIHSEIQTLERVEILRDLRLGKFDVLVGVNLLREGLDLPEVSLVAILDADKEGFLRSETSLIQTMGRAARNVRGEVLLFADNITKSMRSAINESERRRNIQIEYNKKHNITPETVKKDIKDILYDIRISDVQSEYFAYCDREFVMADTLEKTIEQLEKEMKKAAKELHFEKAAKLRDRIKELKQSITPKSNTLQK